MFRNRVRRLLYLELVLGMALISGPAKAASVTLQGVINRDDAVQLFDFTVDTPGSVDIRSYGYAGGNTATGEVAPSGGFDTVLTLFNSTGIFISENDDGAGAAFDPTTDLAADARITANLDVGSYILALSQYDNFSLGNLTDGFVQSGKANFTADPDFTIGGSCPGNVFRDASGTAAACRNGNWTVSFSNVATATPFAAVPEPSALSLAGLGTALVLLGRMFTKAQWWRTVKGLPHSHVS